MEPRLGGLVLALRATARTRGAPHELSCMPHHIQPLHFREEAAPQPPHCLQRAHIWQLPETFCSCHRSAGGPVFPECSWGPPMKSCLEISSGPAPMGSAWLSRPCSPKWGCCSSSAVSMRCRWWEQAAQQQRGFGAASGTAKSRRKELIRRRRHWQPPKVPQ